MSWYYPDEPRDGAPFYEGWVAELTDAEQATVVEALGCDADDVGALEGPVWDWFWESYAAWQRLPAIEDVQEVIANNRVVEAYRSMLAAQTAASSLLAGFGFAPKGEAA